MTYTHARAPFGFGFAEWDILGDDVPAERLAVDRHDLSRGKLCRKGTSKTGRAFYNLQYWHGGRNNVRYVGEAEYPVYAEAVAGYREFMRLVEEYVDLMTGITEEMAIRAREAEDE